MRDLREALAAYDAAPRTEARYRVAFDRLRDAALTAGMQRYCPRVVDWARDTLAMADNEYGADAPEVPAA